MDRSMPMEMDCLAVIMRAWFVTKAPIGALELVGVRKVRMDAGGETSRGMGFFLARRSLSLRRRNWGVRTRAHVTTVTRYKQEPPSRRRSAGTGKFLELKLFREYGAAGAGSRAGVIWRQTHRPGGRIRRQAVRPGRDIQDRPGRGRGSGHATHESQPRTPSHQSCTRKGQSAKFFFSKDLFGFFFLSTNPSQNQGGNMEHGTGHPSPTTGPTRQPLARPANHWPPSPTAMLLANSRAPWWSEGEQGTRDRPG